jgi:hypothetical protein
VPAVLSCGWRSARPRRSDAIHDSLPKSGPGEADPHRLSAEQSDEHVDRGVFAARPHRRPGVDAGQLAGAAGQTRRLDARLDYWTTRQTVSRDALAAVETL